MDCHYQAFAVHSRSLQYGHPQNVQHCNDTGDRSASVTLALSLCPTLPSAPTFHLPGSPPSPLSTSQNHTEPVGGVNVAYWVSAHPPLYWNLHFPESLASESPLWSLQRGTCTEFSRQHKKRVPLFQLLGHHQTITSGLLVSPPIGGRLRSLAPLGILPRISHFNSIGGHAQEINVSQCPV
jgi:hypothetical protein